MAKGQLNGKRLVLAPLVASAAMALTIGAAGASVKHHSRVPTYSAKTGPVPSSERLHTTVRISNDSTIVPAPKKDTPKTSQLAALVAIRDFSPLHVDGRTFYPSVLFGLLTNSVMQSACGVPGLVIPTAPSSTPTTACHPGLFYQRDPVWLVTQHGFCTPSTGGPPPPGNTTTTQPTTTTTIDPAQCVLYTFVSATTGQYLYAES